MRWREAPPGPWPRAVFAVLAVALLLAGRCQPPGTLDACGEYRHSCTDEDGGCCWDGYWCCAGGCCGSAYTAQPDEMDVYPPRKPRTRK